MIVLACSSLFVIAWDERPEDVTRKTRVKQGRFRAARQDEVSSIEKTRVIQLALLSSAQL